MVNEHVAALGVGIVGDEEAGRDGGEGVGGFGGEGMEGFEELDRLGSWGGADVQDLRVGRG